jgi:hypothetical protein
MTTRITTHLEDIVDNLFQAYLWVKYSVLPDPNVEPEDKIRLQLELEELKKKWPKNKLRYVLWKGKEMYSIIIRVVDDRVVDVWLPKDDPKAQAFIKELLDEGIVEEEG